jgi:hypothetical protein
MTDLIAIVAILALGALLLLLTSLLDRSGEES